MSDPISVMTNLDRTTKRFILLALDSILIATCYGASIILRVDGLVTNPSVWIAMLPVIPISLLVFTWLGLYRAVLRYISSRAVIALLAGATLSAATLALWSQGLGLPVPRSVPFIYAALLMLAQTGVRFAWRFVSHWARTAGVRQPVIIYGAGEAGRQLAMALEQGPEYHPVAFIDDDPSLQGALVAGVEVVPIEAAREIIASHRVELVLLAMPSASRAARRKVVESLKVLVPSVKTLPGMADIVSGQADYSDLQDIHPNDLLGRDPVPPMEGLMQANISGKAVMVTGAGGSIGSELCRQIVALKPSLLAMLDASEFSLYRISEELEPEAKARGVALHPLLGSVQNGSRMQVILETLDIDTVYHAAAYKHVPLVEQNVTEGVRNNIFGTLEMAQAAANASVESFILVSTDKAVRPTNIMGASKRMAELVCQSLAQSQSRTKFSMVRFGNVLGSSGSVIPKFMSQIQSGGPVTVTHPDVTRFFMTIPEAAQLVIQAGAMGKGGDVFVLDMGEPVRIADLAASLIKLHGLNPVMAGTSQPLHHGDIQIAFVGLRPGEKLYEELLIGENPTGTPHPRIMTARELALAPDELSPILEKLRLACDAFDVAAIRQTLLEAPTGFAPTDDLVDLIWQSTGKKLTNPAGEADKATEH